MARRTAQPAQPIHLHQPHQPVDDGPALAGHAVDHTANPGHGVDHAADTPAVETTTPVTPSTPTPNPSPRRKSTTNPYAIPNSNTGTLVNPADSPEYPAHGTPDSFRAWVHPASDSRGHASKFPLSIQPAVARQIELMVQSRRFPYRTNGDLIRHAIYQHIEWLEAFNGGVPSVMAQVRAMNELVSDELMLQEQHDILGKLFQTVQRHLQMGDIESADRVIKTSLLNISMMPVGAWRDSYKLKFTQLFSGGVSGPKSRGKLSPQQRAAHAAHITAPAIPQLAPIGPVHTNPVNQTGELVDGVRSNESGYDDNDGDNDNE